MKGSKSIFTLLKSYIKGKSKMIALILGLFILNICFELAAPKVLSFFIDSAEKGAALGILFKIIFIYIVVIITKILLGVGQSYFVKKFGIETTNKFKKDVLSHFLSLDLKHHQKWSSGESITRIDEDTEGFFTYFYTLIFRLGSSIVLLAGALIILSTKNFLVSVVMLIFSLITIFLFKWIQDKSAEVYKKRAAAMAIFNGKIKEKVDNIIEIKTSNSEAYAIHKLKQDMQKRVKESIPAGIMYSKLWSASTFMDALSTIVFLSVSAVIWEKGLISLGTVYLVYSYSEILYVPLQGFRDHLKTLQESRAGLHRVMDMKKIQSQISEGEIEIKDKNLQIDIKDLSFSYDGKNNVIHNINLKLKAGERIGVMGETGSGKSTIAKVIARLYEYENGEILFNGINIKHAKLDSLREKIGYCSQDVEFLHGTLRDNITLYDKSISDDKIIKAIEKAGLKEWFKKFPEGLDSFMHMADKNLSAGEAQLIAIIRLFIKDPSVVILDEISSRLDPVTEKEIMTALDILLCNKTVITIAHKLTALRWADTIMILEKGRVVEYADKKQLELDQKSRFYKLCSMMGKKEVCMNER